MRSFDKNGRTLQEVVEDLLKDTKDLKGLSESVKTQVKIQRLKGELRKYLNRPQMYSMQISYLRDKISELEKHLSEIGSSVHSNTNGV